MPEGPRRFHVVLKPRGSICNLACRYCFYLRKASLYGETATFVMPDEVLEAFTRQYLETQHGPQVTFVWQGGEPTLMGLDFFRKAVALQGRHSRPGTTILNALQTNGVLLDDDWCRFLGAERFLVGLSLDGPCELHDTYRVDRGGKPTFTRVHRALQLLQRHGVDVNVLCVVSRMNGDRPLEVYRFFKEAGVRFIQFIPAVERAGNGSVTDWTVRPGQWGRFLCAVFGEWVRADVGRVFVQHFDVALEAWAGFDPGLCVHARTCGLCLAMEHTGDVFACDHYVAPEYSLGNILRTPLRELATSPFQCRFGQAKRDALPGYCRRCPVLAACNGGCPKDRFVDTPDGEPGLNYLCEGYRMFFTHVAPYVRAMAALLARGLPPAALMELWPHTRPTTAAPRNAPCPCGSGRKYKRCCGRGA